MNKEADRNLDIKQEIDLLNDKKKRRKAIARLGESGALEAVAPLLDLYAEVKRKDQDAICEALEAIARGDAREAALEALVQGGVRSEGQEAAQCALRVLSELDADARPVLPDLLALARGEGDLPAEARADILEGAAGIGGALVVEAAGALSGDKDPQVRLAAVGALAEVDSEPSTAHLITLVRSLEEGKARDLAIKALRGRYESLLARIRDGAYDELPVLLVVWRAMGKKRTRASREIFGALVEIGAPLVPALCATLDGEAPATDVIRILEKLAAAGQLEGDWEACAPLVTELDNPDMTTACAAARVLGALEDERAIPALAARLSYDPALREAKGRKAKKVRKRAVALQRAAAIGLGRIGPPALVAALQAARSEDAVTRCGGVIALGRIGVRRALGTLDLAMEDEDPMVREAAAEAMERVAHDDLRRLGDMLDSKEERTRHKAVKALGKLDDLRSLDLLLRAYGDPSDRVHRAVVKGLARREGERATSMLTVAAAGGNLSALRALEKQPTPQAIPALIQALDVPWSETYSVALHTLRTYASLFASDPQAMAAIGEGSAQLRGMLLDGSSRVRRMAAQTLAALRDRDSVSDLSLLLADDKKEVRLAAIDALAVIGGEQAAQALGAYVERHASVKGEGGKEVLAHAAESLQRLAESD